MLDYARKAVHFADERTQADFNRDELLRLAITRLIEIIGEAARRVSSEFQASHPEIEWFSIISARNRLTHGYDLVDYDIVWEIVRDDLPPLIVQLEKLVK